MASPAVNLLISSKFDNKGIQSAKRQLADMEKQLKGPMQRIGDFGKKMQGYGQTISDVGGSLTKNVTLPIVGLGTAALVTAAEFEKSMNKVSAVSGATGSDFDALTTQAKELGRTTQFSASEAADAMSFLAMAGFDADEILGAMPGTLSLAAAGQLDLADAADIASNILTGYNMQVDELPAAMDTLAKTFTSTNTDLTQLGEAFKYVGPVASTAGVDFNEAAAAIGLMGNAGIQGSMAGTSLRGAISRLLDPSKKAANTMKELGIKVTDSEGRLKPLNKIVKQLADSGAETADYMAIFGQRAGPAMAALVQQGQDALVDLTGELENAGGTADAIAETQMQGLAGAMTRMKSAFEGAMIAIAESGLLERATILVEKLAEKFGQFAEWMSSLPQPTQDMILKIAGIAAAVGPVLMIVGKLTTGIGALIAVFGAVSAPVLAVVAAIAAVVAIVVLLWNKSEAFRNAVMTVWEAIKSAVMEAVDGIKQKLAENQDKIDDFKEGLSKVWDFIQTYVIPAIADFYKIYLTTLIKVIGWVIERLIDWYSFLWDIGVAAVDVAKKIGRFASDVGKAVGKAIDFVKELPGKVLEFFGNAKDWLFESGRNMIQGLLDGAGSLLSKLGEFMLDKLPWWIVEPFKLALGIASPSRVFKGFGDNIVQGLIDGMASKKDAAANQSKANAQAIIDAASTMIDSWDTELSRLKGIYDDALADFNAFRDSISSSITGQLDLGAAVDKAKETGGSVVTAITEQASGIGSFAQNMIDLLKTNLSQAAWTAVNALGAERGAGLAEQMLSAQGQTTIDGINKVYADVEHMANAVGELSAQKWYGQGVKDSQASYEGFRDNYGPNGPARKALMGLMDRLAAAMSRDVSITVNVSKIITETVRRVGGTVPLVAGATGGIVNRPTFALIGEAGPEAVIPLNRSQGNEPLPMVSNRGTGGGNTYNITVQAGVGDPRMIGQQVVEYIKRFESANGAVFAAA